LWQEEKRPQPWAHEPRETNVTPSQRDVPAPEAKRLAAKLLKLLDQVMLDLEHGVPKRLLKDLMGVCDEIAALPAAGADLGRELASFRKGVDGMLRGDPDAPDAVVRGGERLNALLGGTGGSGGRS
jgi:hypothetical protein